jgi:hypothetical protein
MLNIWFGYTAEAREWIAPTWSGVRLVTLLEMVMDAKSMITSPSGQQRVQPDIQEIRGLAWSGRGG